MYLVMTIIENVQRLKDDKCQKYTPEQKGAIDCVLSEPFDTIDLDLAEANERASLHNENVPSLEDENNVPEMNNWDDPRSFLKEIDNKQRKYASLTSKAKRWLADLFTQADSFFRAVTEINRQESVGFSELVDCLYELDRFAEPKHEKVLRELCQRERFELRERAQDILNRICPAEGETHAQKSYQWLEFAENWQRYCDNNDKAIGCLKKAEASAEKYSDWSRCAVFWHEKLNNVNEATRCISEGERTDLGYGDVINLPIDWLKLHDKEQAQKWLVKLEDDALKQERAWELVNAAQTWLEEIGDKKSAARCLKKAEAFLEHPYEIGLCLDLWEKIDDADELARITLKLAKQIMKKTEATVATS